MTKHVVFVQPKSTGGNFEYVAIPRQGMTFLSAALKQYVELGNKRGERVVVGVNRFVDEQVATPPIARIDPTIEREQVLSLTAFKANRDPATLAPALAAVEAAARGTDNLMPPILAAVKVGATVGEISNILRAVFGEYREALVL